MTRIALVTGASAGIGRACALALLADGWTVALVGRRAEALQATIAASGAPAERALAVPVDVGVAADVRAAFDRVHQHFGRLDLLFNNAGVSPRASTPDDLSAEEWDAAVSTNLNGAFYCLSNAFMLM